MCRFVLLIIFSFNILSNSFNCSSTRGSLLSILFLQSYKKAVDEVSDICPCSCSLHSSTRWLSVSSISVTRPLKSSIALSSIFHAISHSLTPLQSFCLSLSFTASDAVSVTIISCTFLHRTNLSQSFTVSEFSRLPRQHLSYATKKGFFCFV